MGLVIAGNAGAAPKCFWRRLVAREADPPTSVKAFLSWRSHAGDGSEPAALFPGSPDGCRPAGDEPLVIGNGHAFTLRAGISGHAGGGDANQTAPCCLIRESAKEGRRNVLAPAAIAQQGGKDRCLMAGNPALVEKRLSPATAEESSHV